MLPDEANMVTVTVESIIQANPDVIIIGSSGNKAQAAIEKIKADPAWQSISAVKNNDEFYRTFCFLFLAVSYAQLT